MHLVSRISVALTAAAVLSACARTQETSSAALSPEVARDLERVRQATAAFRDLAAAQQAGWPNATPPCLANPAVGTMGQHYVKRAHVDDKLELERPEILLYVPDGNGKQKLVAVEYIIPYRIRPRDAQPPRIFGQDLKRSDELSLWYLHVWAWEPNPSGLFADWNPALKC